MLASGPVQAVCLEASVPSWVIAAESGLSVGTAQVERPASDAAPVDPSNLAFFVSVASACRLVGLTWVGIRVLRIARRTRSAPELLLGLSFLSFSTLGVPLLALSGYGAGPLADAKPLLLSLALGLLDFGTVCFAAFVARVFRPASPVGALAVLATAIALLAHLVLATRAVTSASPELSSIQALGRIELVLSAVMSASFAWGAAESFVYWSRLRRQHSLGLADAVAVQRMLLFALGCSCQLAMMGFTLLASMRGTNPLADPLPAIGIAATSLGMGAAFALALGAPASHAASEQSA